MLALPSNTPSFFRAGRALIMPLYPALNSRNKAAQQAFRKSSQVVGLCRSHSADAGARGGPSPALPPALYLVGTPIGNLADLSPRARCVLAGVDILFAEDTRHTAKLLSFCDIHTSVRSLNSQTEAFKVEQVLQHLQQHRPVALVSDAGGQTLTHSGQALLSELDSVGMHTGMPGVSDPGALLAAAAAAQGHTVVPVPGPSACLAAVVASGLHISAFTFVGFLPAKSAARQARLAELAGQSSSRAAQNASAACLLPLAPGI